MVPSHQVILAQPEDIPAWLDLAREVEELFGPMLDDPNFQQVLQKKIHQQFAFCIRAGNGPPGSPLAGGLLWSQKPPVY